MATNWERADGISNTFWYDFVAPNVRRIKNNECEWCDSVKNLEIHHTSYEVVTIDTLKLICKSCHRKEHNRLRREGIILTDKNTQK